MTARKKKSKKKSRRARRGVGLDALRRIALALPGMEEGTSYGTLAFRVRKKFIARMREDGESLVVKLDFDAAELLLQAEPDLFYTTDHYRNYPSVLVRLPVVSPERLAELLEDAWRLAAAKAVVRRYDEERS